ncbi:MAG: GHMP kinase [Chthoniobacterales bacterium]|nr:GHMP kinase [Chthoniobacterales bacterium]
MVRARTPLRLSFGGGGTDVSPYSDTRGGCVLNATISRYVYATLVPKSERSIGFRSFDYGTVVYWTQEEHFKFDGQMDLVKGVLKRFELDKFRADGFDLFVHADAPPGSGLGSSSTFTVALIGLFRELLGLPITSEGMAGLAYDIERNEIGIKGGRQDQYAAAYGGFNFMEFHGDETVVTPLRLSEYLINELEYNLILCFTGSRESQPIIESQMESAKNEEADPMAAMDQVKAIAYEMKKALLAHDLDRFGDLLNEGWVQKKKMAKGITTPRIDELYSEARKAGAIGGKITGAGGGGHLLLYCPFNKRHIVRERLTELGTSVTDFRFDPIGMQTWRVYK